MINAIEAYKKTSDNINELLKEKYKKIEEEIDKAIKNGKYSVSTGGI